jgi:hypothetical protein
MKLEPALVDQHQVMSIKMIYVVPAARSTKAVPLLLFAVRQEVDTPLAVDGSLFSDGLKLIDALVRRKMATVVTVNKLSGAAEPFDATKLNSDHLVILESSAPLWTDLSICRIPHIYSPLFDECLSEGVFIKQLKYIPYAFKG